MENAAKALKIAGGVLLAVIIVAVVYLVFQRMSLLPQAQEYKRAVEQLEEFNKQFVAYEKKSMYGVDVVSCLNKVIDNNKKSDEYMNGTYNIKINIKLKKGVEDFVTVYYIKPNIRKGSNADSNSSSKNGTEYTLYDKSIGNFDKIFGSQAKFDQSISSVTPSTSVRTGAYKATSLEAGKTYTYFRTNENDILFKLSQSTVNMKLTQTNTNGDFTEWSRVEWKTAAYDFKSKKFSCTGIHYSDEGRVDEISFEEK